MNVKFLTFALALFLLPISVSAQKDVFLDVVKNTEVVALAEVVKADTSETFWSGYLASTKQVKYRVITVLKGTINSKMILVGHFVVYNSYIADKEAARLSPELFKKGRKLILLLSREEDSLGCKPKTADKDLEAFCSGSENNGVRPATAKLIEKVEQVIKN